MTDRDALVLRRLISQYGLKTIVWEVYRVVCSYAQQNPERYIPYREAMKRIDWILKKVAK